VGNDFPGIPPLRIPTLVVPLPIFGQYILVSLPKHYLLACLKSVTTKMFEIKSKRNTIVCGMSTTAEPAKRGVERMRIE